MLAVLIIFNLVSVLVLTNMAIDVNAFALVDHVELTGALLYTVLYGAHRMTLARDDCATRTAREFDGVEHPRLSLAYKIYLIGSPAFFFGMMSIAIFFQWWFE